MELVKKTRLQGLWPGVTTYAAVTRACGKCTGWRKCGVACAVVISRAFASAPADDLSEQAQPPLSVMSFRSTGNDAVDFRDCGSIAVPQVVYITARALAGDVATS